MGSNPIGTDVKLIKTIQDTDTGTAFPAPLIYKERIAARAVVFDRDNNIALLHATKKNYHKLPGGGVKKDENIEAALRRELQEEIGCSVENIRELGVIEEYRNKFELHQISYCFLADATSEKGTPHFEEDEIADGFEPEWMTLETAIATLESETKVEDYEGKFIQVRDLVFLKEAEGR